MLDLGLDLNVWPWIWLVIAVGFALIELTVLGGSFILLPFALSAFAASLLGFYDVSVEVQWLVFLVGGGVLFTIFYRWATKFLRDNVLPPGVGADRLVGMVGTVTVAISPDDLDRGGRVSVTGEVWGAISDVPMELPVGSKVKIVAMQGTRVKVEPAHQPSEGQS